MLDIVAIKVYQLRLSFIQLKLKNNYKWYSEKARCLVSYLLQQAIYVKCSNLIGLKLDIE